VDVLSEVLRSVRLESALFLNAEFSAPWCIRTPHFSALAPHVCPGAAHLVIFHFVVEGRARIRLRQNDPHVELTAGNVVMLPHADPHLFGNGYPEIPVDSLRALSGGLQHGLKLARFGGGGEVTRVISGYLACDPRVCGLVLAGLPRLLKVALASHDSGRWIEHAIQFAAEGCETARAGGPLMLSRLSELLLIETLRAYSVELPPEETGWLAGARDPALSHALSVLHGAPAERWTLAELSRRSGLSRTRLAERFRHFLGVSPVSYLAHWRLKLAAEMLDSTGRTVADIAAAVGYGSEPALNRAFRREFGVPPAQFRKRLRAAA